jgi:hypothetical protein
MLRRGIRFPEMRGDLMQGARTLQPASVRIGWVASACLAGLLAAACAPTNVQTTYEREGPAPRPERILVYDIAVAPDEVQLDRGFSAELMEAVKGTPRTEQELQIGHAAAKALSDELVKKINAMGLPAERVVGVPANWANAALVEGQFLSIDEGNRTERVVIGLGAGRSSVRTDVQLYEARGAQLVRLAEFMTDAKSGYKPGAAETMGMGAAAGDLAVSAAVTAAGSVASEALGVNAQADARRTAADVADKLKAYFVQQAWIAP